MPLSILNSSFNSFKMINQLEYIKEKEVDAMQLTLTKIKEEWEALDLKIKHSVWRKENGYYVDGKFKRTLLTQFGLLIFWKTRYKFWNKETQKWKRIFLVDPLLQIEKYSKWSYSFKSEIISLVAPGTSKQKDIINSFKFAPINKSTLSRFIKKLDIKSLNNTCELEGYKIPNDAKKYNRVYISIDDAFAKFKVSRKGKKHQIRLITMYLDVLDKPKDGTKLKHKRVMYEIRQSEAESAFKTNKLADKLTKAIETFFGKEDRKITIAGDGATWIKKLAEHLNADIVLDWFHLTKKISSTFLPFLTNIDELNRLIYNDAIDLLKNGYIDETIIYLKDWIPKFQHKAKKIKDVIGYIKNNYQGIKNYQEPWYNGCFAESNVFHFIKSITNSKSFGIKYFSNLINLRVAVTNKIDPLSLWRSNKVVEFEKLANEISTTHNKVEHKLYEVGFPILEAPKLTDLLESIKDTIKH